MYSIIQRKNLLTYTKTLTKHTKLINLRFKHYKNVTSLHGCGANPKIHFCEKPYGKEKVYKDP